MSTGSTRLKKFSVNFIILLLVFLVSLGILLAVADNVFIEKNTALDDEAAQTVKATVSPTKTTIILAITQLGGQWVLLPANILLILYFYFQKTLRHWTWKVAIIAITGPLVMFLLKILLVRERPLVPLITKAHGYSFPSGHSFSSALFYGMLAFMVYQTVKNKFLRWLIIIILIAIIIAVGYSRVYLNVHYATDVIAGWMLGIVWLLLAKWLLVDRRKNLPHDTERTI